MKRNILLAILVVSFTACSTYKQAQTPDDVYFSPGDPASEPVTQSTAPNNGEYYSTPNDQYVHLKAQDPTKWSYFDQYNTDYYGSYVPYYNGASAMFYGVTPYMYYSSMGAGMYGGMGMGFGYGSAVGYWDTYYMWNSFYNPYYGHMVVVDPKAVGGTTPITRTSTFNPNSYLNKNYNGTGRPVATSYTPYSYSQTIRSNYNNSAYSSARQTFYRPSTNNGLNSNNTFQNRTYSSPSRTSSFGGGGGGGGFRGGGGGGIGRPGR